MGLIVDEIVDIVEDQLNIEVGSNIEGILGSAVVKGQATELANTTTARADALITQIASAYTSSRNLLIGAAVGAIVLALVLMGFDHPVNVALAWGYVVLRILHSLVQATVNVIMLRWAVFMAASIALLSMAIRLAVAVF